MPKKGQQKGAQGHAEGMHGDKTHARLLEQLHAGTGREAEAPTEPRASLGKHRIFEGREQHDEADRNSDRNRLEQHDG